MFSYQKWVTRIKIIDIDSLEEVGDELVKLRDRDRVRQGLALIAAAETLRQLSDELDRNE